MKYTTPHPITLLQALEQLSPESSKTTLRSWLKEERVYVDGKMAKLGNLPLTQGQTVELKAKPKMLAGSIKILFEDRHLVVVDKPTGILSVAAAYETVKTVHSFLKEKYRPNKVYVIHRLDQDTSGVMMFALSEKAYSKLKQMFERHDLQRGYIGIVEGQIEPPEGTWISYLYEDEQYYVHSSQDPQNGPKAITHYKTEFSSPKYSRVMFTLETGRKNQIRAQCQEAGHPIVGDKKYGSRHNPIKRMCLHAYLLSFKHPITMKNLKFVSPIDWNFYA